jgi:PAS domain S-box-containing protein
MLRIHLAESTGRKIQDILDSINDAFLALDREWRVEYANPGFMRLLAPQCATVRELIGHSLWDVFPELADSEVGGRLRRAMETQRPDVFEFQPDPTQAWLEVRLHPSEELLSITATDVTGRKRQEETLAILSLEIERQARLFDAALSNISDLACVFDREARFVFANQPMLDHLRLPLESVLGRTFAELGYLPELAERLHEEILRVIASGAPASGELRLETTTRGEDAYHEYIYNPVLDSSGALVAVAGSTRVTTDSRRAADSIRRLAAIVESSDDAIIGIDLAATITSWNRGAERVFGYTPEEVVGQSVTVLIPAGREDEEPRILARIRAGERIEHYETIRRRKDGVHLPISLTVSPIRNAEGVIIGASKIARDITLQKANEAALKESKEAAEAASAAKDRFLAVLSHELRTPLTPVLMAAAVHERNPSLPEAIREDMAMIRRNVELETKLIDDLLDLNRIASGKLDLQFEPIELDEAVRQVCATCQPEIQAKGVRLHLLPGVPEARVMADSARLQQVIWNVLKNAGKFTPEGGDIHVRTRRVAPGRLEIEIRDTGIGLEPATLPKIFDAFEQGDVRVTRHFGGLGLGLAISKALVTRHGGEIRAESEGPGRGATFRIELAEAGGAATAPTPADPPLQSNGGHPLRILLVEDHADTARMLSRLLEGAGYSVKVAGDAASALRLLDAGAFDLLVSDLGLPDSSGLDLMRRVRELHGTPGIATSGYGMDEDVRKSLEAGFSEHLTKPVNLEALERAIRRARDDVGAGA